MTSALLWRATLVAAVIDVPLLALVARKTSAVAFRELGWLVSLAAFLVFGILWGTFGAVLYWDAVYRYVFPPWFRWLLPVVYGGLFAVIAFLLWRIGIRARRWPALWFCLLGGLVSIIGHGIGIRRGLLRAPLLAEASAASALVFGVFEFIAYWCAIVGIAMVLRGRVRRR